MSRKDYKQGAADAMNAYEAFARKQEAATHHVANQIGRLSDNVDKLGKNIEYISDYITDKEKQALYKASMPVDIADLDETDQYLLVAVLYELAQQEFPTEEQQNYIRAIQKYLKIKDVQRNIDLNVVAHIPDTAATIAIMQSVMEFFYLGTHPGSYTEEQMDLLDLFMANRMTRKEITARIKTIVNAVGKEGLAEKYGFAPEENNIPEKEPEYNPSTNSISESIADQIQLNKYTIAKDYFVANMSRSNTYRMSYLLNEKDKPTGPYYVWDKKSGKLTTITVPDWDLPSNMQSFENLLLLGDMFKEEICIYNLQSKQKEIVCRDCRDGRDFSVSQGNIAYISKNEYLMLYNIATKRTTSVINIGYSQGGRYTYVLHNNDLFYCKDGNIYHYDINTKLHRTVYAYRQGFIIRKIVPYLDKLYVLLVSLNDEVVLLSININSAANDTTEHFHFRSVSGYGEENRTQVVPYWIYVKDKHGFPVYCFNMDNETLDQVASDCGSTTYGLVNDYQVVGNYLYFQCGNEDEISRISLLNPTEGIKKLQ